MVSKKSVSKKSVVKKSSPKKSAPKKMSAAQKAAVAAAAVAVLGGAAVGGRMLYKKRQADDLRKELGMAPYTQPSFTMVARQKLEMAKQYLMKRLEAIKAAYQKGFFTASQAKKEEEKAVKEAEQIAKA